MMFPPNIFGRLGVRSPVARSADYQLVPRRLRGGESQITGRSGQICRGSLQILGSNSQNPHSKVCRPAQYEM